MIHSFFSTGSSLREHRLCGLAERPGAGPETGNLPGIDAINGLVTKVGQGIKDLFIAPNDARQIETQKNMANPRRWIEAFQRNDAMSEPQLARETLRNRSISPQDYLQTLSPKERVEHLLLFASDVLPPEVVARLTNGKDLAGKDGPGLQARITLVDAVAFTLGLKIPPRDAAKSAEARGAALEALLKIYPRTNLSGYSDYRELVRMLGRAAGTTDNRLTEKQLENREELLKLLDRNSDLLPPGNYLRFAGLLRLEDPAAMQARLTPLSIQFKRNTLVNDAEKLKAHIKRQEVEREPGEKIDQAARSPFENMEAFWNENPVFAGGLAILGAIGLYKIFTNKKGTFMGIPNTWLKNGMIAVVGYGLYDRIMNGNENAFGQIATNIQSGLKQATDFGMSLFRKGILPPTLEQQDMANLNKIAEFATRENLKLGEKITAIMTVGEVQMKHFAGNAFTVRRRGRQNFYGLHGAPGSNLYKSVQAIIQKRKYKANVVNEVFGETNQLSAQLVGRVFFRIAAERPENKDKLKRIKDKLPSTGRVVLDRNGKPVDGFFHVDMDDLPDPERTEFLEMIEQGRTDAIEKYGDKSIMHMIERYTFEAPLERDRIENAESVRPPSDDPLKPSPNKTRKMELAMYKKAPVNLPRLDLADPDKDTSAKRMFDEFSEFTSYWNTNPHRILDFRAAEHLDIQAREILKDREISLPEASKILRRIKYAVLLTATTRGEGAALTVADVTEIIGEKAGASGPAWMERILSSIGNWINRKLKLDSSFGTIETLENAQAILKQRLFSGVESGRNHLPDLQAQLTRHKKIFDDMRVPTKAADRFVQGLSTDMIRARFGTSVSDDKKNLSTFIQRLAASTEYQTYLKDAEREYAGKVVEGVLIAQKTQHRANGQFVLDENPSDCFVSNIEEQNLIADNEMVLEKLIGTNSFPLQGMWATRNMNDLLDKYHEIEDKADASLIAVGGKKPVAKFDLYDQKERGKAILDTKQLAYLYLSIRPITKNGPDHRELQRRVASVLNKFVLEVKRVKALKAEADAEPAGPDKVAKEAKHKAEKQKLLSAAAPAGTDAGINDPVNTARLLGLEIPAELEELDSEAKNFRDEEKEAAKREGRDADEETRKVLDIITKVSEHIRPGPVDSIKPLQEQLGVRKESVTRVQVRIRNLREEIGKALPDQLPRLREDLRKELEALNKLRDEIRVIQEQAQKILIKESKADIADKTSKSRDSAAGLEDKLKNIEEKTAGLELEIAGVAGIDLVKLNLMKVETQKVIEAAKALKTEMNKLKEDNKKFADQLALPADFSPADGKKLLEQMKKNQEKMVELQAKVGKMSAEDLPKVKAAIGALGLPAAQTTLLQNKLRDNVEALIPLLNAEITKLKDKSKELEEKLKRMGLDMR